MTTIRRISSATALAALVILTACSGGDDKSVDTAAQSGASTTVAATIASTAPPTTAAGVAPATVPSTTTAATKKVSANNASIADLTAAFEAAGISNAARWAREVDEYRPYPNDPNLPKLRQELAKYNPGPGVVDQIVATLSLP
jgi:uncharacterized protein YggE